MPTENQSWPPFGNPLGSKPESRPFRSGYLARSAEAGCDVVEPPSVDAYTCRLDAGDEAGNVGPSDRDQNDPGGRAPGCEEPTRAIDEPGDDNWLRFVGQNSSEIVVVVDPDGTLRYASPAFGRILGYVTGEALGKNVLDFVHPDDLSRALEQTERVTSGGASGGTDVVEYRLRHKDGSWRWMEVGATNRLDDPAVGGIVVNARDVTERKGAEERTRYATLGRRRG